MVSIMERVFNEDSPSARTSIVRHVSQTRTLDSRAWTPGPGLQGLEWSPHQTHTLKVSKSEREKKKTKNKKQQQQRVIPKFGVRPRDEPVVTPSRK